MGTDLFTKALLHMDGANNGTSFIDDTGKVWTAAGAAKTDTSRSVFGGSCGTFDGTGDYIYASNHADWVLDGGSNSNEWTIDFWVYFTAVRATNLIGKYVDANNYMKIYTFSTNQIGFSQRVASTLNINLNVSWSPSVNTWYHVAIVKEGTTGYKCYVNGAQIGATYVNTTLITDLSTTMRIGGVYGDATDLAGSLDEVRISKGIARWTANFTVPSIPYVYQVGGNHLRNRGHSRLDLRPISLG